MGGILFLLLDITHKNRSYRDSETKENVEAQKGSREGETTGRGQRQLNKRPMGLEALT